jgi:hypothetical protein
MQTKTYKEEQPAIEVRENGDLVLREGCMQVDDFDEEGNEIQAWQYFETLIYAVCVESSGAREHVRRVKLMELEKADEKSNSFEVDGVKMWLTKDERSSLASLTLPSQKAVGETTTTLWGKVDGVPAGFQVNIDTVLNQLLPALENYAKATFDLLMQRTQAVMTATTTAELLAIDAEADYPETLKFVI